MKYSIVKSINNKIPNKVGLASYNSLSFSQISWIIIYLFGSFSSSIFQIYDFNNNLSHHDEGKYLFICRSGIRSNFAALTVEESFKSGNYNDMCFNIEDGFEGFEQPSVYSQNPTGWKNLGLPWSRVN